MIEVFLGEFYVTLGQSNEPGESKPLMESLCSGLELFSSTCFVLLLPKLNENALGIFGNSWWYREILQSHITESLKGQEESSDLTEQLLV
jgi:hypothetical protein